MSFILGYTGGTLDRADHLRRDAQAIQMARMHPSARWLVLDDLKPVLTEDGSDLLWARRSELEGEGLSIFLGLESDGSPRFATDCAIGELPGVATDARAAGMRLADGRSALIAQARSVLDWHRRHGFCAVCGTPTHPEKAGYSRVCPGCGAEVPIGPRGCPKCTRPPKRRKRRSWERGPAQDGLDLPEDDFDYDEFVAREFGKVPHRRIGIAWYWWMTAVVILILLILEVLSLWPLR